MRLRTSSCWLLEVPRLSLGAGHTRVAGRSQPRVLLRGATVSVVPGARLSTSYSNQTSNRCLNLFFCRLNSYLFVKRGLSTAVSSVFPLRDHPKMNKMNLKDSLHVAKPADAKNGNSILLALTV